MARISVFEGGNIQPQAPTVTPFQAPDFGPGIGEGIAKLGEGLGEAAQVADRIGELHDEAAVKEAVNKNAAWFAQAGYTGPNAYFAMNGRDALDGRPMIDKGLTEMVGQTRATLQNRRQQFLYDQAMAPQVTDWQTSIAHHAMNETATYASDQSQARAALSGQMASLRYLDNPSEAEQYIETMKGEIANRGKLEGWSPDRVAATQLKSVSGTYHDIGTQIAAAGPQGWDLAREFVKQHEADMTSDDRQSVLDRADTEQQTFEAEQRRQEADQRRQETEDKRDARSRVETAIGAMEDTHQPMNAADLASVMADAQTVGDPNLVKRVHDLNFKNGVAVQYNGVSPGEIQNEINALSARITKAGAKADPEDILKRDTLQGIYNSSKSELDSNPMAWGARNLGIQVQPLVLGNPASIQTRISQANLITQRTGHAPQPLQPEEVAQFAPIWKSGDVQQKVGLVTSIAQFGPMAGEAAQQIAPNDNGFTNLIGIASHANRAVAMSRVNQIITGYEAIKTMPKLVNQQQALQQFHEYLGQSLQFLPGVADGVFTNAKALLASEANSAGVSDWNSLDSRAWFKAVNSALGAYTKDGKQYGGIATFNGVPTVLPENMAADDFEGRISRASGPQFRAAQNGVPVFGNGEHPTASDLKKMQWVPSNDGTYRLSDGSSFLHTANGGFYEIDVRKLPSDFDAQLAALGYVRR